MLSEGRFYAGQTMKTDKQPEKEILFRYIQRDVSLYSLFENKNLLFPLQGPLEQAVIRHS